MKFYKSLFTLILLVIQRVVLAQDPTVEMADGLRSSGKIYVVVAVLVCILAGILFYLINTEKKLKQLEDEFDQED